MVDYENLDKRFSGYECEGQMDIFDYEKEMELEKWISGKYMALPCGIAEDEIRADFEKYSKNIEERDKVARKG